MLCHFLLCVAACHDCFCARRGKKELFSNSRKSTDEFNSKRQPFRSLLLSCVCLSSASHSACLSQPILPLLSEFGAASISRQSKAIVDRHLSHGKCESVAVRGDAD